MRPTELTDEVARKIIAARARGLSAQKAAARGGIIPKTLYNWLARGEAESPPDGDAIYVAFAVAYREAEADRQEKLLNLSEADGPNAKDRLKLLELTFPHEFGTRQIVEHTGADGGAIQIDDARARLMALLDRHASKGGAGEGSSEPQSS